MTPSVAPRETARPASPDLPFDVEADVVVVGGGGGGLPTALFARWLGNEVVLLEKAAELGGTANKAAFWYWVPNNEPMRAAGLNDTKEDYLRYMARLSRPERYDPTARRSGMTEWEYAALSRDLRQRLPRPPNCCAEQGALDYRHCPAVPDYWAELPGGQGAERPRAACRRRLASPCRTAASTRSAPWRPPPSATASTSARPPRAARDRRRRTRSSASRPTPRTGRRSTGSARARP